MRRGSPIRTPEYEEANVSILGEVLCAAELLLLHAAPSYYGLGISHGDGSAVVLIPAFLCPDAYLTPLHQWLARIGYNPFFSGIGFNTECPNLLIRRQLNDTVERALSESGRKVHLIGHSLGGIIARAIAAQRPKDVASVITLGAPFRGTVAHPSILHAAEVVRRCILARHGSNVLPDCYTGRCTCDFWIHCSMQCRLRYPKPQSTARATEWWTGGIARQIAGKRISPFRVRILDWSLIPRHTPSLQSVWLRLPERRSEAQRLNIAGAGVVNQPLRPAPFKRNWNCPPKQNAHCLTPVHVN